MAYTETMQYELSLRKLSQQGGFVLAAFLALSGYWATAVPISGAVVTMGQLMVNNNVRKVQHPSGGVVGEIRVREGDVVNAGDIVVRLDETVLRATLTGIQKKIDELEARAARLNAERLGYAALSFPNALKDRRSDAAIAEILTTEEALYDARKASHILRKQRLDERVQQMRKEAESQLADLKAKTELAEITNKERTDLASLERLKLLTTQRRNTMARDAVSLLGQQEQIRATISQTEGRIVETQMQQASLDDELRAETTKELRETQAELAQQLEKRAAATDQLQRVDIRAPISGRVHQLAAHTVGGVIMAAEPVMLIVPTDEQLELEARVQPHDIDQLHPGQPATVRINAFNRRTTPEIEAEVTRLSPDVMQDKQTGAIYYTARLTLHSQSLAKLEGMKLQPGMQAEALIKTADRTPWQYLSKPISDQMNRALRER